MHQDLTASEVVTLRDLYIGRSTYLAYLHVMWERGVESKLQRRMHCGDVCDPTTICCLSGTNSSFAWALVNAFNYANVFLSDGPLSLEY